MSIREISEGRYTIQAEIVNTKLHGRVETIVVLNNPTSISDLTIFDIPRNVITKWNIQLRKETPFNLNLHVTKKIDSLYSSLEL